VEIDERLSAVLRALLTDGVVDRSNERIRRRLSDHIAFVTERERVHGPDCFKYRNKNYGFPVMTKQEVEMKIEYLKRVRREDGDVFIAQYTTDPCLDHREVDALFARSCNSTK
jgi:hypothetical protein